MYWSFLIVNTCGKFALQDGNFFYFCTGWQWLEIYPRNAIFLAGNTNTVCCLHHWHRHNYLPVPHSGNIFCCQCQRHLLGSMQRSVQMSWIEKLTTDLRLNKSRPSCRKSELECLLVLDTIFFLFFHRERRRMYEWRKTTVVGTAVPPAAAPVPGGPSDECCGSGMFIPDPNFLSRIPDPHQNLSIFNPKHGF